VDAGAALTTVASNVSSSTVVTVGDAGYFHYDWGGSPYDRGDSVAFISGGVIVARGELDSIDYPNRHLILKSAISVSAGAGVHVLATYKSATASYVTRLSGSAPDIGPYERTTTGGGGSSLPGSTTLVAPDSNSSQMQPVTFRWRSVSGATRYWFSLSGRRLAHAHPGQHQKLFSNSLSVRLEGRVHRLNFDLRSTPTERPVVRRRNSTAEHVHHEAVVQRWQNNVRINVTLPQLLHDSVRCHRQWNQLKPRIGVEHRE